MESGNVSLIVAILVSKKVADLFARYFSLPWLGRVLSFPFASICFAMLNSAFGSFSFSLTFLLRCSVLASVQSRLTSLWLSLNIPLLMVVLSLRYLLSAFLRACLASWIELLYQGAWGRSTTSLVRRGACCSRISARVWSYSWTRLFNSVGGDWTRLLVFTLSLKASIFMFFIFLKLCFVFTGVGRDHGRVKESRWWSEWAKSNTERPSIRELSSVDVTTTSSMWPRSWVGSWTCW